MPAGLFRRLLIAAALAAVAVVVYAPTVGYGFVNFDDNEYVYENPRVLGGLSAATVKWAFATGYAANYIPLTWVSLAADASVAGPKPADLARAMHRTNVALHAATVAVLFLTLAAATGADAAAAVVAAVFAVHPLHVESVAWVTERKDVLCGLFYAAAVAAHVAGARTNRRWAYPAELACGAAALLSKPMAVSLPAVLLLVDYWPLRRFAWGPLPAGSPIRLSTAVRRQVPLVVLTAALCWATVAVQSAGGSVQTLADVPAGVRARNVPVAVVRYLGKFAWPADLSPSYPFPPLSAAAVVAGVAVLVGMTVVAVRTARTRPYVIVGWAGFLVTLAPVIGIVQVGFQAMADRYMYLPLVGPAVIVVWAARDAAGTSRFRQAVAGVAGAVALVAAGVVTHDQMRIWSDSRSLFGRALAVDPADPFAHAQVAYLDRVAGDPTSAERHYRLAVAGLPRYADAAFNLANLLLPTRPAEAARLYDQALAARPHDPLIENNLAVALADADPRRAADLWRAAAAHAPEWAEPHVSLGRLLLSHGRPDAAAPEFARALQLDPSSAPARRGLAACTRP